MHTSYTSTQTLSIYRSYRRTITMAVVPIGCTCPKVHCACLLPVGLKAAGHRRTTAGHHRTTAAIDEKLKYCCKKGSGTFYNSKTFKRGLLRDPVIQSLLITPRPPTRTYRPSGISDAPVIVESAVLETVMEIQCSKDKCTKCFKKVTARQDAF